jgi:hypothetical protein
MEKIQKPSNSVSYKLYMQTSGGGNSVCQRILYILKEGIFHRFIQVLIKARKRAHKNNKIPVYQCKVTMGIAEARIVQSI